MLTADQLNRLAKSCGGIAKPAVVSGIVENQQYLMDGGINTPTRLAEFMAQACLETDYFKTLREYASGADYEGRDDLGNVVAGDGKRFRGRGIFQCTGRSNYREYGRRLGIDLLKEPALAERPDISVRIAVLYWNDKGLNAYADIKDTKAISRAINRGNAKSSKPANHEADRVKIAKLAHQIIVPVKATVAPAKPIPASAPVVAAPVAPPAPTPAPEPTRYDGAFAAPPSEPVSLWSRIRNSLLRKEP